MSKLLYIKCNMKDINSSRTLSISGHFLKQYRANNPEAVITELDLFASDVPGIDKDVFSAWGMLRGGNSVEDLSDSQKQKLARIDELTSQFIEADRYVFSFPMWNLSCPAEIKKYIDNITIVGKTFKYTEKGPVGLLNDKERKAVIFSTYGGFHLGQKDDFCAPYVESLMRFVGIGNIESIVADGLDAIPDKTASFIDAAKNKASELAATF